MYNSIQHFLSFGIIKLQQDIKRNLEEGKTDIGDVVFTFHKHLNELGRSMVKEYIEGIDEEIRNDTERLNEWEIVKNDVETSLLTSFGDVRYSRTYFESKVSGKYAFLAERMLGIKPRDKVSTDVEIRALQEAVDSSYKKSGKDAVLTEDKVSKQKVMNTIKSLENIEVEAPERKEKKKVKILYVEADEDHVALQTKGKKSVMPKLVYIHEGIQKEHPGSKRSMLLNSWYFGGLFETSDKIWLKVMNYIYDNYDWDYIEKIYLAGDGASWIRKGLDWIGKKGQFVLDKYHLKKYIIKATGHIEDELLRQKLKDALDEGDYKYFDEIFREIYKRTTDEKKRDNVKEAKRYIANNWDGIEIYEKDGFDVLGCSAEGHVSHILSDRLSSRPMGWSKKGVDNMTKLRVYVKNGGKIYQLVMANKKAKKDITVTDNKFTEKILKKNVKSSYRGENSNIEILNMGKRTQLYRLLKNLNRVAL